MFAVPVEPPALVATVETDRQQSFVVALPAIEARARSAFKSVRHYHDREDAVAEVVARAWEAYLAAGAPRTVCVATLTDPAVAVVRATLFPASV